jgi:hypothetical protein
VNSTYTGLHRILIDQNKKIHRARCSRASRSIMEVQQAQEKITAGDCSLAS